MMGHRFAEGLQSGLKDIRYSRSRMKEEDQTPQDQPMARPTHRPRIETGFGILAFSVVFLQKFGFALLGDYIGIDAFILFGVLLWLFIVGDAVIDLTRFVLYGTLFLSVCLSLFLRGDVPSVPAVTVMLGMYFSFLFRVNTDHQTMLRCINKFQVCMVWIAIIILLQQLVQYTAGHRYWPNLNELLPKAILVGDYNYIRSVAYRSPYLVPQGVFGLEPSVYSAFLATAAAAEIVWFKRTWRLGLYLSAVLVGGAGTGISVLVLCSIPLSFHLRPRWRRWMLIFGGPLVVAMLAGGAFDHYLGRMAEFSTRHSSAYERMVVPLEQISTELGDPSYLIGGNGPGTSDKLTVPMQKMLVEYGLLVALLYHAYLLFAVMGRPPSRTVAALVALPHLLFGGGFVTHTNIMMLVMMGSLMSVPALKLLPLGHHPIPGPSPIQPRPMVGKRLA